MVRGPSALLGVALGALAYFLLAPLFHDLGDGDAATLVEGGIGLVLLGAIAVALLGVRDALLIVVPIGLGCGLLAGALEVADVGAAANVPKAVFAAAAGMVLARALAMPVVVVAVPLFVAGIDIWSVASGPSSRLLESDSGAIDFLSYEIPAWGGGVVGRLGLSDIVFLAMFAALAWRYDLRRASTATALVLAPVVALAVELGIDDPVPVLPFLAAALLLPNLDRLAGLLRDPTAG